jgi:tripartite-type tricarboxylate transporter receptor subunit TctC
MLAPANTPRHIVAKVNGDLVRILKQPEVHGRLTAMAIEIVGGSPDELARHIRSEIPKWARVVKQSGARVD